MKLYNKILKSILRGLNEGIFDDDLFDTDDTDNVLSDIAEKDMIKSLEKKMYEYYFVRHSTYGAKPIDNTIHAIIDEETEAVAFLYDYLMYDKSVNTSFITSLNLKYNEALEFINYLDTKTPFKYFLFQINIEVPDFNKIGKNKVSTNVIDFKNIKFGSYYIKGIHPINMICDKNVIDLYKKIGEKELAALHVFSYNCDLSSITIDYVDNIEVRDCYNMEDYSFIKHIARNFLTTISTVYGAPKTHNMIGLPNGDYTVSIKYDSPSDRNISEITAFKLPDDEKFNLIGWPSLCSRLNVTSTANPRYLLPYMSFEGLTNELLPKFNLEINHMGGRISDLVIQLGPYKLMPKCRSWHPTKPQYNTIVSTQDWFLDCYKDAKGPNREYVKPDNEMTTNVMKKEQAKIDAKNLEIQDEQEDSNLMVSKAKKILQAGTHYISSDGYKTLYITKVTDDKVSISLYNRNSIRRTDRIFSFANFVSWLKASVFTFKDNRDDPDTKSLNYKIINTVLNRRARIKKQRKEEAREQRKQERAALKAQRAETQVIVTPVDKSEKQVKKEPLKLKKSEDSKIHIYDYSDRSIAIYGDYSDMKDIIPLLKDLGCKYNKFLTINGKKQPGWIIGKRHRKDIENIINNKEN